MKIIGITGGIGSGKSTLCAELKKKGADVIDTDLIAREITQKGKAALGEIKNFFGADMITESGELDRKKLAGVVFANPEKLKVLNAITHKYIFEEMEKQMREATSSVVVLDVPLLFQCDFPIKCDLTVAVLADKEARIKRVMQRDGVDRDAALLRMKRQLSDDEFRKLADVCFENDGSSEKLKEFAAGLI